MHLASHISAAVCVRRWDNNDGLFDRRDDDIDETFFHEDTGLYFQGSYATKPHMFKWAAFLSYDKQHFTAADDKSKMYQKNQKCGISWPYLEPQWKKDSDKYKHA